MRRIPYIYTPSGGGTPLVETTVLRLADATYVDNDFTVATSPSGAGFTLEVDLDTASAAGIPSPGNMPLYDLYRWDVDVSGLSGRFNVVVELEWSDTTVGDGVVAGIAVSNSTAPNTGHTHMQGYEDGGTPRLRASGFSVTTATAKAKSLADGQRLQLSIDDTHTKCDLLTSTWYNDATGADSGTMANITSLRDCDLSGGTMYIYFLVGSYSKSATGSRVLAFPKLQYTIADLSA